ncbi:MAG: SpoIIE family protein phosphatase [Streptosporangiales bacterium]
MDRKDPTPDAAETRQLDLMFARAPFGIAYLDTDLRVCWTNPAYAGLTGIEPAELRGVPLDAIYPDLDAEAQQLLRAVRSGQQVSGEYLIRLRTNGGADAQAHQMTVFGVATGDAAPHGLIVSVREATAEVEATAQLAIASQRLRLLSELGGQLSATLDVDRLIALAMDLLTPLLGDACAVEAGEEGDEQSRVFRAVSAAGRRFPTITLGAPSRSVRAAVESAQVVRYPMVPAGSIEESDEDRPGQTLVVPMRARQEVVGAVTLARLGTHRTYQEDEITLAVEAADRIGMAVDNARLFARQRDAAVTLQHTLLPQRLPDLPGIDVAARYIPGSAEVGVGGDWFDLTPLPDGTLGVVIGDVMGRGVRAAAVMGQLRAAVRAYTVLALTPSRLLACLDRVVTSLGQVQLVTCLYGVLDQTTGAFTYASAGHHPPLLRLSDGTVYWLHSATDSPPLGVMDLGSGAPAERVAHVPRGATLLLYTDGLVEERHTDLGVREGQLALGFGRAGGGPEEVVDAVLAAMGRDEDHTDDIALLAVHLPAEAERAPAGPEQQAQLTVTGESGSVANARHFLTGVLDEWGLQSLVDTGALLVSEAVTNALLHARSAADVHIHRTAAGVEVEVRDLDERVPAVRVVDGDSESGRGLYLLEALASDWGAEPSPSGKRVWFRLDLPGDQ